MDKKVTIRMFAVGLVLALLIGSGFSFVGGQAESVQIAASPDKVGEAMIFDTDPDRNPEALWSLEARQAAQPLAWNPRAPDESANLLVDSGPAGLYPGGGPDLKAFKAAAAQYPEAWKEISKVLANDMVGYAGNDSLDAPEGTIGIFDTYQGNKWGPLWMKYPHITVGRLYIDGGGYCSASVLSPKDYGGGFDIIVTAAHCVYDGGWFPGWVFVPSDRKGVAPFGAFDWAWAYVLTNWQTTYQTRYDVAILGLDKNSAGYQVTQYTGYLGLAYNWDYVQHLFSTGYPSNLSGAGKWTHICASEGFYSGSADVIGMSCDMMWGSSGGPWLFRYEYLQYVPGNYVMSVVSGDPDISGYKFYGPRFSSNNIVVLCNGIGGCY